MGLIALTALGCVACANGPDSELRSGLDDVPQWYVSSDLRIGSISDPDQALSYIHEGLVADGPDGRVYLGQPQAGEIRMYDASGNFLAAFGRSGEGPGEFSGLSGVRVVNGRIYAIDSRDRSIEFFSLRGEHLGTRLYRDVSEGEFAPYSPMQFFPDGSALAAPARPARTAVDHLFVHVDSSGALLDTLLTFHSSRFVVPLRVGDRSASVRVPFGGPPLFAVSTDGKSYWVIGTPADAVYVLNKVAMGGDTLFSRSFQVIPVEIPGPILDSAVAATVADARRVLETEGRARSFVEDNVHIPSHYRPALSVRPNPGGGVWIEIPPHSDASQQTWVLHSEDGDPISKVTLPAHVDIVLIDESRVLGIERDEYDVPNVVRFRIDQKS